MKYLSKLFLLTAIMAFVLVPQNIFSQNIERLQSDDSDEYENDGDFYEDVEERLTPNGKGDQYISIQVMPTFPLTFGKQLYVGGALTLGYHQFLSETFAVGLDASFGYHPTIGSNIFTVIPVTVGVTWQPYIWRFEFPISVNIGMAIENYVQYNYFPGLVAKGSAGCYYRMNESWSFGVECQIMWLPQWYKDIPSEHYLGISAIACARYHF